MGSLVIWVIHICWLASGPGGERFQWNLPDYFHISHFLPLVFKILPFTYFCSPLLLESGGQRKGMANEVRGFKHTDTFWFSILSLRTPGLPFTLGLSCSLPFYIVTCEYLCSDLSMVSLYISIYLHTIFLIYTGQWHGPVGLFVYCVWIPWRPL